MDLPNYDAWRTQYDPLWDRPENVCERCKGEGCDDCMRGDDEADAREEEPE